MTATDAHAGGPLLSPSGAGEASDRSAGKRAKRHAPKTPVQQAVCLLTRREHSRQELERKLIQRGVAPDSAAAAVTRLAEAGWQDDRRFAAALARARASAGYGPAYIHAELITHGVAEALIEQALQEVEVDWIRVARQLLERRHAAALRGDRTAQRKAMQFLLRRGFGMEQARAALVDEG